MKPKKLCQRCGDPATWYSNVSGEDLCTPHYNAERRFMEAFGPCDDVVSEARPMRPWRWDAVGFKAVQVAESDLIERIVDLYLMALTPVVPKTPPLTMQEMHEQNVQQMKAVRDSYWHQLLGGFFP